MIAAPIAARAGAVLAAALILVAAPLPAAAECVQLDPWPEFRDAAPVAERVIIGKVVESYDEDSTGRTIGFRFRVDDVLRGESPDFINFHAAVKSGAPLKLCPGDSILRVRVGDVLAFALDAQLPEYPDPVLAVAFVNREPDDIDQFLMPGIERLSRAAIRNLVDLPSTDLEVPPAVMSNATSVLVILAAAAAGAYLAFRRTSRRPTSDI